MTTIHTSAPGSIMISGEHAVVYGHAAVVAAIEQRIHVYLSANNDDVIRIHSALGDYEAPVMLLKPDARLRFVLACLERYPYTSGIDMTIDSAIDPTLGLGSSAAVTVATLGALACYSGYSTAIETLHRQALTIVRSLQGRGSGADLAASLHGGMIAYRNLPVVDMVALPIPPAAFSLCYAGYKTPTAAVLALIAARMKDNPRHYERLYHCMGESSADAITAAQRQDWQSFYHALHQYQQWMRDLGVSDDTLESLIAIALKHSDCRVAKISGSGLGDCVFALSDAGVPSGFSPIQLAVQGLSIEIS